MPREVALNELLSKSDPVLPGKQQAKKNPKTTSRSNTSTSSELEEERDEDESFLTMSPTGRASALSKNMRKAGNRVKSARAMGKGASQLVGKGVGAAGKGTAKGAVTAGRFVGKGVGAAGKETVKVS